jgi:uncharacterized protein (DUF488 family)
VWTIGHSRRSLAELLALLRVHGVSHVVDVRRYPRARRHPHFDGGALGRELRAAGIGYAHAPGLGGFRRPRAGSANSGVEPASRGYADYMQTDEFAGHLATLTEAALRAPTAIMCAEADPLHCHRSFIADALAACGIEVRHILGESSAVSHALRQSARVAEGRVSYPGPTQLF